MGIAQAQAEDRITLYTGNDDHIVADLLTPLVVRTGNREVALRFQGGLLGPLERLDGGAVQMLQRLKLAVSQGAIPPEVLALDCFVTDCNSVVFDVDHDFAGCIPGCHEILRRQGLMTSIECLDPHETLSPGQSAGIDRLYATYPELNDDAFVAANLERWRSLTCNDLFATHDALAVAQLVKTAQARRARAARRHAGEALRRSTRR